MSRLLTYGILNQRPSYVYLLDEISNGRYAYSLDKLNSGYSGYSIEVQRHDNDDIAYIGFNNNVLDVASLLSFGSGATVGVRSFYDQLGGPRFLQATKGNQPLIMSTGSLIESNGKPALYFNGSNSRMLTETAVSDLAQPCTYILVFQVHPSASTSTTYVTMDNSTFNHRHIPIYPVNTNDWRSYAYNTSRTAGTRNTNQNIAVAVFNTTSSALYLNNSTLFSGLSLGSSDSRGTLYLGCANNLTSPYYGYMQELVAFSANKVSDLSSIFNIENTRYNAY